MKKIFVFVLLIIMAAAPAWAGDTDPDGVQLRKLKDNYLETAPPGDETAEKLKAVDSANYKDWSPWLCSFETVMGIGAVV